MEKQRLMNVYVNNLTMMESVNRIHDMIREKQTSYVVEVNVDVVMKMEKDPYLKKISDEADLTLVDGQPLVWISKACLNIARSHFNGFNSFLCHNVISFL